MRITTWFNQYAKQVQRGDEMRKQDIHFLTSNDYHLLKMFNDKNKYKFTMSNKDVIICYVPVEITLRNGSKYIFNVLDLCAILVWVSEGKLELASLRRHPEIKYCCECGKPFIGYTNEKRCKANGCQKQKEKLGIYKKNITRGTTTIIGKERNRRLALDEYKGDCLGSDKKALKKFFGELTWKDRQENPMPINNIPIKQLHGKNAITGNDTIDIYSDTIQDTITNLRAKEDMDIYKQLPYVWIPNERPFKKYKFVNGILSDYVEQQQKNASQSNAEIFNKEYRENIEAKRMQWIYSYKKRLAESIKEREAQASDSKGIIIIEQMETGAVHESSEKVEGRKSVRLGSDKDVLDQDRIDNEYKDSDDKDIEDSPVK